MNYKVLITTQNEENIRHNWRTPIEELKNNGWKIYFYNDISKQKFDSLDDYLGIKLSAVLYWCHMGFFNLNKTFIFKTNALKCFFLHDVDKRCDIIRKNILPCIDIIFTTYKNCFSNFYPKFDLNKVYSMPFGIPRDFIPDFNENPRFNALLLSGTRHPRIYPMRQYIYKLYRTKIQNGKRKYKIHYLPNPGYKKLSHNNVGKNYIYKINNYISAFTCSCNDKTPYVVNKFYEIPAAGALLLAYDKNVKEELQDKGFIDGVNYISVTKENIIDKILYVTDIKNHKNLLEIRRNGYNLILNNHLREHRAIEIDNIINEHTKN